MAATQDFDEKRLSRSQILNGDTDDYESLHTDSPKHKLLFSQ